MNTRTLILVAVAAAVLLVGLWYIDRKADENLNTIPESGVISMEGTIVCLPHRDTTGPQTMECAYGLHGKDGNYYHLTDPSSTSGVNAITSLPTNTEVFVEGNFTREEGDIYATVGTIMVGNIMRTDQPNTSMENTHSDGTITFSTPEDFGLAVSAEQVLINSVIPPCPDGFLYCIYYQGAEYENTNFESAGLSIAKRGDLTDSDTCLNSIIEGYTNLSPTSTTTETDYDMSLFSPLEDAGAGHLATGEAYRLFTNNDCYEITLRVGETQYDNMSTTTTEEFTDTDRADLMTELRSILSNITLDNATGTSLIIPGV